MLCWFLRYKVNQPYVYIPPLPLGFPSTPTIPPLSIITEHEAELPALYQQLPTSICFTRDSVSVSVLLCLTLSFLPCVDR